MKTMARNGDVRQGRPPLKKIFIQAILVAAVCMPLILFYGVYMPSYQRTPVHQTAWVSWQDDPSTAVHIGWETIEESTGVVRYGLSTGNLALSVTDPTSRRIHSANLTGLMPDTVYYYKVEVAGAEHASGRFRTAPAVAGAPFTFGLYADTQPKVGPGWHFRTAQLFAGMNLSFVSMVGDFVEDGIKNEWNEFFSKASAYLDTIPFVPVQGNHDKPRDLDGDGVNEYYFGEYFPQTKDTITNTNQYDTAKQFYFSFNWSSVHFQVLHFPEVDIDDFEEEDGINPRDYCQAFTADHLEWLEWDLNNSRDMPFRVTLFHCPMTGAGFYGPNFVLEQQLLPILQRYNVSATIHGHAHHYERGLLLNSTHYPDNPLTYLVVGCGGGLTDVGLRPVPETITCIASPCYTLGHATEHALTFTTYTFEGTIVDTFTIHA